MTSKSELSNSYEIHPAATIFPMMTEEEYQGLKQDIAENGQREDIVVWCNQLLDGRNRLRACEELDRTPQIADLDADVDPWKYVISHNLHRRHLTTGQRGSVAAKLADLKCGGDRKSEKIKGQKCTLIDDAARALNVSPRTVKKAKRVTKKGSPELIKAVEQGDLNLNQAEQIVAAEPDKKKQSETVAKLKRGEVPKRVPKPPKPTKTDKGEDEPENCKLKQFKRFWADCSDIAKVAIRLWLDEVPR